MSKGKIAKRIAMWLGIVLLLIIVLWGAALALLMTPSFLTPRVIALAQQGLKSEFSVKNIDVSLFERFPNVTLRIDSLRITQTKDSIPDLLFARECRMAIDPMALLGKRLSVKHMALRDAQIYLYVDSLHGPLKCFNLSDDLQEEDDSLNTLDLSDYRFSLRRMVIDSVQMIIDDRNRQFYTRIDNYHATMSMRLSSSKSGVDLKTGFGNMIVWHQGDVWVKKTAMELDTRLFVNRDSLLIRFDRANVKVNEIDFTSSGELRKDSISGNIAVDISSQLSTPSLAEFLNIVPTVVYPDKEKITTQGSVDFALDIKGEYGEDVMPTVAASINVFDAKAKYVSQPLAMESVSCDLDVFVDPNNLSQSYTQINRLYINTSNIVTLKVAGKVSNMIESPYFNLAITSDINFGRFTEVFPLNEGLVCSGHNVSEIKTNFSLAEMMAGKYAKLYIEGESTFKDLEVTFDASKFDFDGLSTAYLYLKANGGKMLFGDRILADNDSRTLRSKINFSGLNYRATTGEYLSIRDIELMMGANFDRSTSAINGIGMRGIAKNTVVGVENVFDATLESSDLNFSIKPKNESHNTIIKMNVVSEHIAAQEPTFNTDMALTSVTMNMNMQKVADKEWDTAGEVAFTDFGMYSDLFPLQVSVPETEVSLENRVVYLKNASLKVGESELVATGHISNLIRKFLVDPELSLSGELAINASYLDITELMDASNKSYMMFEASEDGLDDESTAEESTEEVEEPAKPLVAEIVAPQETAPRNRELMPSDSLQLLAPDSLRLLATDSLRLYGGDTMRRFAYGGDSLRRRPPIESDLFMVPRKIDFVFDLNIDKARFEDAIIENLEGRATIGRATLMLEKLKLRAIGAEASGSMIYKNIRRRGANVNFNMSLADVDINRIGELLPTINTMFPMLESFEGIVNFDIKANATIKNDLSLDVSSLSSAMSFKGKDLVLMDGDTFASISKMLLFKNKDRNLVDSLEVYALANQSTIDVLPFSMSIDRYTAIIGGTQDVNAETFDVDYKYNISILKSPLPFKAGVDITGDLSDFKFKITTAKLKNTDFNEQRTKYEEHRDGIEF